MKQYKVESVGLSDKVYSNIKEMILNRDLIPGQKLVQEEVAERLGVSRTPILSAFSKLEKEWLVKNFPRRGYYIYEMSLEERINLFEIRLRLEPLGARRAAEFGTEEDKDELLKMVNNADSLAETKDFAKFNKHDYEFHKLINSMSRNEMLSNMISSYNIISLSNQNIESIDFKLSIIGHKKIAQAIASGNPDLAEEVMKNHIEGGLVMLKDHK